MRSIIGIENHAGCWYPIIEIGATPIPKPVKYGMVILQA
jgi:hypothetical protein